MKIKHYIDLIIQKKNSILASLKPSPNGPNIAITQSAQHLESDVKRFTPKFGYFLQNNIRHAHLDPLKPFILPRMFVTDYKSLKSSNRVLTDKQYESIFKEKINLKNFMNESQEPILKKMYDDLKFVYDALAILKPLKIDFTIDLTGGAVRDFVLGKGDKIKDLDIMISMSSSSYSAYNIKNLKAEDFIKLGFEQRHLDAVEWGAPIDAADVGVATCKLIALCFEKHSAVTHKYYHFNGTRSEDRGTQKTWVDEGGTTHTSEYGAEMTQDRLQGVIKLSHPSFNYEIDLLVTDLSKPKFLNEFDIDLCKASFSISNAHYKTSFPKDHSHLVSRFIANQYFWADVVNKTLTVNTTTKSKKMVASTIDKHLPRVEAKYSDYSAQFFHLSNPKDDVLEFANLTYNLKKEIPINRPALGAKNKI